jgi:hypothetical protein
MSGFDFQGAPLRPGHAPLVSVIVWWNDEYALWTVQRMDGEGNSLDAEAYLCAHKGEAVGVAKGYLLAHPDAVVLVGTRAEAPEPIIL